MGYTHVLKDDSKLPIIEDLLQESKGNVFSTIDLQKAFYRIPIAKGDIEKAAVTTPFSLFDFLGTSLGLRNAAQSMQRTMDHVIRNPPFTKVYIDDIFVASANHNEHLQHLCQLFAMLRETKLRINRKKCTFGTPQALYLGLLISENGIQPPPERINAIQAYSKPLRVSDLKRFLGVITALQAPLHDIIKGLNRKASKLLLLDP